MDGTDCKYVDIVLRDKRYKNVCLKKGWDLCGNLAECEECPDFKRDSIDEEGDDYNEN